MNKNSIFIAVLLLILTGCGYTTHGVLPSGEPTIAIENFVNKIDVTRESTDKVVYYAYRPGMEAEITREVINRLIADGNFKVKDASGANFLLKGQLVDFKREPLRYDANDNIIEYRVSVATNLELYDIKAKSALWAEKNFAGESTYRKTGQFAKSEDVAMQNAIKDLARRIVERAVENW